MIRRIGPVSCAKIAGILYAVFGFFLGGVFTAASLAGRFTADTSEAAGLAAMIGIGAVVLFPIFYGVIAFMAAFIAAWLYNLLAEAVGGIELELQ